MRILLTGISGFVGPRLARHLLARGDEVAGTYLDVRPDLPGFDRVELHEADLLDRPGLARVIAAVDPEAIVNLAGLSHVGESWKRMGEYFRVNVIGTENLLAAAAGRKVVVASSAEVYGAVPEDRQPISEEQPVDPRSPYALTKAAAERFAYAYGAVVVRAFNLVGPGQAPNFALPAFATQLARIAGSSRGEQEPVLKVGNLSARRDFLHVDDGAAAFRLLVEKGEPGSTYNLASGTALSIAQALERLMAVSGVSARIETDPERMRPADVPFLLGDNRRLTALGWKPERSLDQALADLWAAVRG
jgi:GDP-4-dehydro-6-deoxy-D-mannose reductase